MSQIKLIIVALVALAAPKLVFSASFIELNDSNKAILSLELSKHLQAVQDGSKLDFKFASVTQASDFLRRCHSLKESMASARDDDYQGMAKTIKELLADQSVATACQVDASQFESRYASLDHDFSVENLDYLSEERLNRLIAYNQERSSDAGLDILLGHLLQTKIDQLGKGLLENGAQDVKITFDERLPAQGMFDFEMHHKTGCAIEELNPICKLVRRSRSDDITATGEDVDDFKKLLALNDEEKLKYHQQRSGVDLDHVKIGCKRLLKSPSLKVAKQIDGYKGAGFLDQTKVVTRFEADELLYLYYEIYHLCVSVANQ